MSDTEADPEKYIKQFEALLANPDPKATRSTLWIAWHYLQVYSHWGLRLPHTEAALAAQLGTTEPKSFLFFAAALEGYQSVHGACETFLSKVFVGVVDLGTKLRQFAEDASGKDTNGEFTAAVQLVNEGDNESALELLFNLQETASQNARDAAEVARALGGYQANLITAQGHLTRADEMAEKDAKTSQATIDRLQSTEKDPEKAKNSLAGIKKFIEESNARYKQYVTIAATTPTYVWIFPFGLIAAAAVAGVYGSRARAELELLQKYEADFKNMEAELRTAVTAKDVQLNAHAQLAGARSYTKAAIGYTTDVQNAWKDVAGDIGTIHESVKRMTKPEGNKVVPAATVLMNLYARKAAAAWGRVLPALNDLTDKPYITIKEGAATFDTLLADKALGA